MSRSTLLGAVFGATFILFLPLAPAQAQFVITYVATFGSDVNDSCAIPAGACRTLQRRHNETVPGGKIIVLDSGDFQSLTITKSISVVAKAMDATLFAGSTAKIAINAGPDDVIRLDGLYLFRGVPGSGGEGENSGIRFNSGGRLQVRNCTIRSFGIAGIEIVAPGPSRVEISDCVITDNRDGIWVRPTSANIPVLVERVTLSRNTRAGIRAQTERALVRVSNSTIANNQRGINSANGGRLVTFGNNVLIGNNTNGEFTGKAALQ